MSRFSAICAVVLLLVSPLSPAQAAITLSGDVSPTDSSNWTSSTLGYIGNTSAGTATVDGGSNLLSNNAYIGNGSSASGLVTVSGVGSKWVLSGSIQIGPSGSGTLTISSGGSVSDSTGLVGYSTGSTGLVTVSGSSTWTNTYGLWIGSSYYGPNTAGNGTLNITNGGTVTTGAGSDGYIGFGTSSVGKMLVDGTGSMFSSRAISVGVYGDGTLEISNGGTIKTNSGTSCLSGIGGAEGSNGVMTVSGAGSTWTESGCGIDIGYYGNGTLNIAGGGAVSNVIGCLGSSSGASGTVTLDGIGSKWTNSGSLYVGYSGMGTVTQTGGTNSVGGILYIGYSSTGNGAYNLNGGVLAVQALSAGSGTAAFNFGGGTLRADAAFTSALPMIFTGTGGTATVNTQNYAVALSGSLSGTGGITKLGAGTLTLSGANNYAGLTTVKAGTLELGTSAQSAVLTVDGVGADVQGGKLVFDYTGGSISSPAATIKSLLAASYHGGWWDTGQFLCTTATGSYGLGWTDDGSGRVTVMYTVYGDANLDGSCDGTDLGVVLADYNKTGGWSLGDFNYDGSVDGTDLGIVLANYNKSVSVEQADNCTGQVGNLSYGAVPEPSTLALALAGLLGLLCRAWLKKETPRKR